MTWTIHSDEGSPCFLSSMIAEGTKLLLKWAFLQSRTLYLRPYGSNMKNWLRGCSWLPTIKRARRAIASSFAFHSHVVVSLFILDAMCGFWRSLVSLVTVSRVKKQGEQYIRMGWMLL